MRILVTGASGFLGSRIVRLIAEAGDTPIAFSRYSDTASFPTGTVVLQGDIRNRETVLQSANEAAAIIHVAAKVGDWGSAKDFFDTNVEGTQNIIDACRENGIKKLVYCSTPSVVFSGTPIRNGAESLPYAGRSISGYQRTKMEAEKRVLAANQPGTLMTTALRPHAIWGPDERHSIPRILTAARRGILKIVGDGTNRISMTHVQDAAIAHLKALDSDHVGGKAYFVNDSQPVKLWDWYAKLLEGVGLPIPTSKISFTRAYRLAGILEFAHRCLPFLGAPRLTRYTACLLAKDHFFDTRQAQNDFGFCPEIDPDDGMAELIDSLRPQ